MIYIIRIKEILSDIFYNIWKSSRMIQPNDYDILQLEKFEIFDGFNHQDIKKIIDGAALKNLRHREMLYSSGDSAERFAIVLKGALKLVRPTTHGDDVIVYFATPGDVVGALLLNQRESRYPINVKALGPTTVVCIPRATYEASWMVNAKLQTKLGSVLFRRMKTIQDDKTLIKAPLAKRIAALLIGLLARNPDQDSNVLMVPLTRQEIADSLGVACESVIRIMSDWNHQGLIHSHDKFLEVDGVDRLIEIVNQ